MSTARRLALIAACTAACVGGPAPERPGPAEERLREAARLRGVALAAIDDGDCASAVPALESLATILPDNVLPPVNLAICRFQLGDDSGALAEIDRARELAPDNPQVLFTLARILDEADDEAGWRGVVDRFAAARPADPRPHYLTAERRDRQDRHAEALAALNAAVKRDGDNLVLLLDRLVAAAYVEPGAALDAVDAVEDRLNGFDSTLAGFARTIRRLAETGQMEGLAPPALAIRNVLRPTDLYSQGLLAVAGGRGPGTGMFPQLDFEPPLPASIQGGQDIALSFSEATVDWGLDASRVTTLAAGAGSLERDAVWLVGPGGFRRSSRPADPAFGSEDPALAAALDLDQDGVVDLAIITGAGELLLLPSPTGGDGAQAPARSLASDLGPATGLWPVDVDHDGDLDLLIGRLGRSDLYLQNHGDGSWSDRTAELGIGGPDAATTAVASADFDDDGDLDLLVVHPDDRPRLYLNTRTPPFPEVGDSWSLGAVAAGATLLEVADFDGDGLFDLVLGGPGGGAVFFNRGGVFQPAPIDGLGDSGWTATATADYDNDGDPDVLLSTAEDGLLFLRNRRSTIVAEPIPAVDAAFDSLIAGDYDGDGDLDAVGRHGDGRLTALANQGGHRNQWLRLRLRGKPDNNSKNNTQGLFARIETRSGAAYQLAAGNGHVNHLGLGASREADVLRVVWTNGLAQTWARVASRQALDEEQVLKGSCPFLYAWNGREYVFVTDLMWPSPLGMVLADGSAAPHQPARDWVLVPAETLVPAAGELWLQITEELWETAYVDRLRLLAVDHPAHTPLIVDEGFAPPPRSEAPPLHWGSDAIAPRRAVDQAGVEVTDRLTERDGRYVDDLPLDRYQGLTRGHWVDLEFAGPPPGEATRLVLWGWTFPTDTSINYALSQDASRDPSPPRLSIRTSGEPWRPLDVWVGFPNGKRKAVVVELPDLPASPFELRIETNLQIYWDAARLVSDRPAFVPRVTSLAPTGTDLHYRGFSRMVRTSTAAPHLFDYRVVDVRPRFRDMRGRFTRFGAVDELLVASDDRYVVMNAGDELTVRFDASGLPPLADGWIRDWALFTDGWVKDGDIRTTASQTVEPYPYGAMRAYPDEPSHDYPRTPETAAFLDRYQTRWVDDRPFRHWLRETDGG